jgi:flavorubredoxin
MSAQTAKMSETGDKCIGSYSPQASRPDFSQEFLNDRLVDYSEFYEIAEGVYWVGYADIGAGLHCNPYLIVDNGHAVLIDSGGRAEFSTVMLKILRTGTHPGMIKRLVYQHFDPDLCANMPHMEAIIGNPELAIIAQREDSNFIKYYAPRTPLSFIEDLAFHYEFPSGRRLDFIRTPFAHSAGSFMTYDSQSKILFSSDILGSYDHDWSLFSHISEDCLQCDDFNNCSSPGKSCHLEGILDFHRRLMPSKKALLYAFSLIGNLNIAMIAPQHGSILNTPLAIALVIERLINLPSVGIDYYLERSGDLDSHFMQMVDIDYNLGQAGNNGNNDSNDNYDTCDN